MDGVSNVGSFDTTTVASYASLSFHSFKTKEDKKLSDSKLEKTRYFKDIIKETFIKQSSLDSEKNVRLSEEELIAKMQDEVYATGDALSDMISTENILAYKKAIKSFVEYILEKAYDVENVITGGQNPLKKKKAWTIVKVINTKLDKLISDLMYNQLKKIEVLKRIDEIKGLIVDLRG